MKGTLMAFDPNFTFTLSSNQYKKEDKHPDYKGKGMVDGTEYQFAAWVKEGKDGGTFLSGKITPKQDAQAKQAVEPKKIDKPVSAGSKAPAALNDDIPF